MIKIKKKGLGKGLSALIPDKLETSDKDQGVVLVDIDKIKARKDQPRKTFDEDALDELAQSIREYGLIQPIILSPSQDGYEIIAGERRYRACQKLGLERVEALIKDYDSRTQDMVAVIENIQREDLNPLEEALAYRSIMDDYGLTQQDLADRLGKSRSYIANNLRLLNLDDKSKKKLVEGKISSSQARALLSIKDLDHRHKYLADIEDKKLTVNELEKKNRPGKKEEAKDIYIVDMEDKLKEALGTKVSLTKTNKKWSLTIEAYSDEQVESIIDYLIDGREV